jgi:hypothetical protein
MGVERFSSLELPLANLKELSQEKNSAVSLRHSGQARLAFFQRFS